MPYHSNSNVVLYDDCKPLLDLTVLLEVTEDISTLEGDGFSLQVNCCPQAGHSCQSQSLVAFQYVVLVWSDQLYWAVQYWSGSSAWPPGYTPMPGT